MAFEFHGIKQMICNVARISVAQICNTIVLSNQAVDFYIGLKAYISCTTINLYLFFNLLLHRIITQTAKVQQFHMYFFL